MLALLSGTGRLKCLTIVSGTDRLLIPTELNSCAQGQGRRNKHRRRIAGTQSLWDTKVRLKHVSYSRGPVSKHEPEHGYSDLRFSELFNCNEAKKRGGSSLQHYKTACFPIFALLTKPIPILRKMYYVSFVTMQVVDNLPVSSLFKWFRHFICRHLFFLLLNTYMYPFICSEFCFFFCCLS